MFFSCQKEHTSNSAIKGQIPVYVNGINESHSKTSLSGLSLVWTTGDAIGVFVDGKQVNRRFVNQESNLFSGSFVEGQSVSSSVNYVAYYPYSSFAGDNFISAELKSVQNAPFDPSMDFMVSNLVPEEYDEEDLPNITFSFNNHLFSILKVTFTNTDSSYKNEKIAKVVISSKLNDLVGMFSFNVLNGQNATPQFSNGGKEVSIVYSSKPTLSTGVDHSVYAIIKEGTISDLSLKIYSDNTYGKATANIPVTTQRGFITSLPKIDFSQMIFNVEANISDLGENKYNQDDFWIL